ncbi:MAG: hypothetical protein COA43_10925 [Robiginitomaculum sp.]|nr:MAG: hypothetical protein COA43_10925 [Robiginitomaculum sp.]
MSVIQTFPDLIFSGKNYDFDHLKPQTHTLEGQGNNGKDILIRLSFESHVFSRTPLSGERSSFRDRRGQERVFCVDRYDRSLVLDNLCADMILQNFLTWESKDRNSKSNLAVVRSRLITGLNYAIFYYLFPSRSNSYDVEIVIKSAYEKYIDFSHIKRRNKTTQLIKKCYFQQKTIP